MYERDGLGTHWWFELLDAKKFPKRVQQRIDHVMDTFNADYSRFLPDSYIGTLNDDKKLLDPSPELVAMFEFAHKMYDDSDGAFNISVGGALHAAGYGSRMNTGKIATDLWQRIKVSRKSVVLPADVSIDFGGFGKGWLIDTLGRELTRLGHRHYVINGGGDMLVSSDEPIELGLEHPYDATKIIGTTRITRGALAVSSNVKRTWKDGDVTYAHIIDPTTSTPSNTDVVSTYIKADTALVADTLATVLLLRPDLETELCDEYQANAIILRKDQIKN